MKTLTLSIIAIMIATAVCSQNDQYFNAMQENLKTLAKAKNNEDFQELANQFERIAGAETGEWLPLYYAGYCYINMSFSETNGDKIDLLLDKAQKHIDRAEVIAEKEEEIILLQGFLYLGRISVDPMERGRKYSGKAEDQFIKAKKINPENPRTYFLLGMNTYNMPEMFGGGAQVAQPYFEKADEKFATFEPQNELYPDWGMETNKTMLKECNKQIGNN